MVTSGMLVAARQSHLRLKGRLEMGSKARIAIDGRELGGSGTGRYVERLLHYLQTLDHENEYFVLIRPGYFDKWNPKNKNFTKVKCPHKEFTFSEQLGLMRQIRNLKLDLIHFPMVQQPVFYKGKTVTTMNDLTTLRFRNPSKNYLIFTIKRWVYWWVNKVVTGKSNALITFTKFVAQDVANFAHVGKDKITVINLAAEELTGEAEPIAKLSGRDFIMFTGRPLPHKNLYRLIEAFANLSEKHPDLILAIIGKKDASFDSYISFMEKLGVSNSVVFTDYVPDGQLKWALGHTKAYIFPSLSEGFGLPGLEAMHYGAPVVSSSATCLPEVYENAAHYFDPTDVNDITSKINDVLSNEKLRKDLIKKGKIQVNKYSWKDMAEQTLAVYKKVLSEN
jgi:glycosyltransferase involved in cell wall biosynthesis